MKTVGIIEARMRSSRLPGKVLRSILGRPMLELMIERLRRARTLDRIVIATTDQPADDAIADLGEKIGVGIFRGSEDDVLLRVLETAQAFDAEVIVELTGDCPLIDPEILDQVVREFRSGGSDFCSNTLEYTAPRGTGVRGLRAVALADIGGLTAD